MKKLSILIVLLALSFQLFAEKQTVVLSVPMHCESCKQKIEKNIAFEKGVKDLICDLKKEQVTVVFDNSKTSVSNLIAALKKINLEAKEIKCCSGKPAAECCKTNPDKKACCKSKSECSGAKKSCADKSKSCSGDKKSCAKTASGCSSAKKSCKSSCSK